MFNPYQTFQPGEPRSQPIQGRRPFASYCPIVHGRANAQPGIPVALRSMQPLTVPNHAQKMTGAHGVAPVIWKEGKEKSWEGCRSVPFGSVRIPCRQQVVYQL